MTTVQADNLKIEFTRRSYVRQNDNNYNDIVENILQDDGCDPAPKRYGEIVESVNRVRKHGGRMLYIRDKKIKCGSESHSRRVDT